MVCQNRTLSPLLLVCLVGCIWGGLVVCFEDEEILELLVAGNSVEWLIRKIRHVVSLTKAWSLKKLHEKIPGPAELGERDPGWPNFGSESTVTLWKGSLVLCSGTSSALLMWNYMPASGHGERQQVRDWAEDLFDSWMEKKSVLLLPNSLGSPRDTVHWNTETSRHRGTKENSLALT